MIGIECDRNQLSWIGIVVGVPHVALVDHLPLASLAPPVDVTVRASPAAVTPEMTADMLPRSGGSLTGFQRQMTAPTLGPRGGPNTGSHSIRLPLGMHGQGAPKHYSVPSADVYRPSSRGGLGTTFGPRFGKPVKPRFPEPHSYTARAFNVSPLPPTYVYKEPQSPSWRMSAMSRSPSALSMSFSASSLSQQGRTSPQQWTPGGLENVILRRSYAPDESLNFGRPRAMRPITATDLMASASMASLPSRAAASDADEL